MQQVSRITIVSQQAWNSVTDLGMGHKSKLCHRSSRLMYGIYTAEISLNSRDEKRPRSRYAPAGTSDTDPPEHSNASCQQEVNTRLTQPG